MFARLGILVSIAARNLFRSRINLLIGSVILGGTLLVVVGGALLNSVISSMSRSIIGSVAGHIQVYSAASKEEFAIWPMGGNDPDLSPMVDWERKQRLLESVPNVKAVIPMGINAALITSGNTVDLTLEELRSVVREAKERGNTPELDARRASLKEHVRQIVRVLRADLVRMEDINTAQALDPEARAAIERASSDAFWDGFDRDPYAALEFLENRLAPQLSDADLVPLRYVGTDLDAFQENFDRMEIVDGQPVPPGHRGFLMSKLTYEDRLKLRTARRLDKIKDALDLKGKIARDETLQRYVHENRTQTREILLQLDRLKTEKAVAMLQRTLASSEKDLDKLLDAFFDTDDTNFYERYQVFYRDLAPLLQLYRLKVGDILTITAFTRSGYVQSLNLKVWGTFQFRGLEKSALSGNINLMDIVSFRELYGYLSADRRAEIEAIKKEGGAREIDRSRAEEELFGQPSRRIVAEATPGIIDEKEQFKGTGAALRREELVRRVYDPIGDRSRSGARRGDHPPGPAPAPEDPGRHPSALRPRAPRPAGGLLARGGGAPGPVHPPGHGGAPARGGNHLHRGHGHHQQLGDDGHPPAHARGGNDAGHRRSARIHPGHGAGGDADPGADLRGRGRGARVGGDRLPALRGASLRGTTRCTSSSPDRGCSPRSARGTSWWHWPSWCW